MPFIVDWYPDYWNQQEREELFMFWRSKYHYNKIKIALSSESSGGQGFFDAELVSFANLSERSVVDELHPINSFFNNRKEELIEEIKNSQDEDQFRIILLMQAEKSGYDYWQYKNIYNINTSYPIYIKQIIQNKIENLLSLFKDSLAQLIEYDRENGNPLTDPDRNLEKNPPSVFEYRRWLTRGTRIVDIYSEEEKELKKLWSETHGKDLPDYKENILPSYLEEKHIINKTNDSKKNLERNKSGFLIKTGEEEANNKPPVPLILSRLNSLADSVNNFKIVQEDIRPEIEEITLDTNNYEPFLLFGIDKIPVPEKNPYPEVENDIFKGLRTDEEFHNLEQEERIKQKIDEILDSALHPVLTEKENLFVEDTDYLKTDENYEPPYSGKEVYEIPLDEDDTVTYISEDTEEGKSGKGEAPEWMKKRNFDGHSPEWFIKDNFEREKEITFLSSKMELTEKIKNQTRRSLRNTTNVWKMTSDTVKDFKTKALSLWKRKVAPSLGLETPERRAIAKIQKQELKHLQRTINKVKRQYKLQEQKKPDVLKPRSAF